MRGADDLLTTIEAVYSASLDTTLWPQALAGVMRCVGGIGATLEFFDPQVLNLTEFYSFGIPPANELAYLADYSALSPRLPYLLKLKPGEVLWDYIVLDEQQMNHDPFYSEFLAPVGFRYFIGATLQPTEQERTLFSVQRATKQGHAEKNHITAMRRLLPHVQQAVDVARRLKTTGGARHSLESGLDWLADGVALVRADGHLVYANEALQAIARADDGIRIRKGALEFATVETQGRYGGALAAVHAIRANASHASATDFAAPRRSGNPPFVVSVRPLPSRRHDSGMAAADVIVFIRDPLSRNAAAIRILREVFGLTEAEAGVAQALQTGIPVGAYAQSRAVSLNTVYTHLRRIKEKTGCNRMTELIRKLNDLQVPLRLE